MSALHLRMLALSLAIGVALAPSVAGQESSLSDADREAFAWFDGLGYPSCAGRPFVRITRTLEKPETPKEGQEPWWIAGFLLAETPEAFEILGTGLFPESIPRARNGVRAAKEPLELRKIASDCLEGLRAQVKSGSCGGVTPGLDHVLNGNGMVGRLDTHSEVFVLARRCAENGLEELAGELLAEIRRVSEPHTARPIRISLSKHVRQEIASAALWRFTANHDDASIPRPRLLEEVRVWLDRFPDSPLRPQAEEAARILATTVAEDAAHREIPADRFAALPVDQRVRELIFQLRDQDGCQMMEPGSPSVYGWGRNARAIKKGETPAGRIEAIGMDAVPALIEALEDPRFTRTVGFLRSDSNSYYVARIGDATRELLENITGQVFWRGTTSSSSMFKDGFAKETKEKYLAWWKSRTAAPAGDGR